jgi:hypothetical protein
LEVRKLGWNAVLKKMFFHQSNLHPTENKKVKQVCLNLSGLTRSLLLIMVLFQLAFEISYPKVARTETTIGPNPNLGCIETIGEKKGFFMRTKLF